MIQANELRLGNWVLFDVEEVYEQITPRRIGFIAQANSKGHSHPFKPIPLTDTIIEKLPQFKKVPYLGEDGHYYEFDLECGLGLLSGDNNDVLVCDLDNVRFEYLHQLQNFVASLGIELEVKI